MELMHHIWCSSEAASDNIMKYPTVTSLSGIYGIYINEKGGRFIWDGSSQIIYKGEYTENTLPVFSFS